MLVRSSSWKTEKDCPLPRAQHVRSHERGSERLSTRYIIDTQQPPSLCSPSVLLLLLVPVSCRRVVRPWSAQFDCAISQRCGGGRGIEECYLRGACRRGRGRGAALHVARRTNVCVDAAGREPRESVCSGHFDIAARGTKCLPRCPKA